MNRRNGVFVFAILLCVSTAFGQVTGSGTKGAIPVWTSTTSIGNSPIITIGGGVGIGTKKPGALFDVESSSTTKPAVIGNSFASTGTGTGVLGTASSPSGIGVQGFATTGGFFQTPSATGVGVFGIASSTTGTPIGVLGQISSTGSWAVTGVNTATTGGGGGVLGISNSGGPAVNGGNNATSGFASAIYGSTSSTGAVVALLRAQAGGDILTGQFGVGTAAVNVARIDSTGKGFFDGGTQTGGADFAESVAVAQELNRHEPGDLLVVDTRAARQLRLSSEPYSTLVAGIYSTKPGVLATPHKMDQPAANEIPLAIVGIVPCKVSAENGPIEPGDLLVTSASPGYAMKGTDRGRMLGAVVGKALEPLTAGKGVVQVLVTLQ